MYFNYLSGDNCSIRSVFRNQKILGLGTPTASQGREIVEPYSTKVSGFAGETNRGFST